MKTRTSIYHRTFAFAYVLLVAVFNFFKKVFTHNYCDTCGFTKDNVYVTEYCMEAGIIQYNSNNEIIAEYYNGTEASKITGIAHTTISAICNNKYKYKSIYKFKFKDNEK